MWTKLCVIVSLLSVAVAGEGSGRIVNGRNTTVEEHPYQLSLEYHQQHYCGAVLIRRNIAISGAHCFLEEDSNDFQNVYRVRTATSFRNEGGKLGYVRDVIIHPSFDQFTYNFDVAVIKICNCFDYTPAFYRIDMVPENAFLPEGQEVTMTGFGYMSEEKDSWAPVLQAVTMAIVDLDRCASVYAGRATITDSMLCAGSFTGEFDFCFGDTGGPLVANGVLVGLASWGEGCAEYGYPGVYTRISAVRRWIDSQL